MSESSVAHRKKKQPLTMRLAEACAAVPAMDKLGRNPEYNYVRASQIFEAFRAELLRRDILLLPDEKEVIEKDVETVAGPTLRQVTLRVEYELRDCRSEEKIIKSAFGVGIDAGDKAIYKAKTGALKYFFRVLGIIPWIEKDDPEWDASIDELTDPRIYAESRKKRPDDRQMRAFDSACHSSGKTAEQVNGYLRTRFDIATIADLARGDFNEAIKWAYGAEAMEQTLATSVQAATTKKSGKKPATGAQPIVAAQDVADPDQQIAGD